MNELRKRYKDLLFLFFLIFTIFKFLKKLWLGAWVAQLANCLTLAQVMILGILGCSLAWSSPLRVCAYWFPSASSPNHAHSLSDK